MGLAEGPGGHAALVLDYGGFDGVDEFGVEGGGEVHEERFVDAVEFDAVGGEVVAAGEMVMGHADGGGEAAEEESAGLEDSPEILEHGVEVGFVAGEVEDGAAMDDVEGVVGECEGLERLDAEVGGGESGGEKGSEFAGLPDGFGVVVVGKDFEAFAEEIDEVASGAAAGVEDGHAGEYVAAEEVVEEVDVDGAELLLEGGGHFWFTACLEGFFRGYTAVTIALPLLPILAK